MSLIADKKVIHLSNLVPLEFCKFFTHVLLRHADLEIKKGDEQVPTAKAVMSHEIVFETLLEYLWPTIEQITGEELLPTYAYARLYSNGDVLTPHVDRPACEISVTIQLGRSQDYAWPIVMAGKEYYLNEGDAAIYLGTEIEHWRNVCAGPEGYYSGQVFLHYVRKNGQYKNCAYDERSSVTLIKNRV